jgi:hypothetical protein
MLDFEEKPRMQFVANKYCATIEGDASTGLVVPTIQLVWTETEYIEIGYIIKIRL